MINTIATFRIDERLIHGQIIATWLNSLGITHIIVAADDAAKNEVQQKMLKLAIPPRVKCLIKSVADAERILKDPRCKPMKIMLITGNPKNAVSLLESIEDIPEVNLANYGTITKPDEKDKLVISPMVSLDKEDVEFVNKLIEFGKPVFTQKTPVEQKKMLTKI